VVLDQKLQEIVITMVLVVLIRHVQIFLDLLMVDAMVHSIHAQSSLMDQDVLH
jgi:hypothetical protein